MVTVMRSKQVVGDGWNWRFLGNGALLIVMIDKARVGEYSCRCARCNRSATFAMGRTVMLVVALLGLGAFIVLEVSTLAGRAVALIPMVVAVVVAGFEVHNRLRYPLEKQSQPAVDVGAAELFGFIRKETADRDETP